MTVIPYPSGPFTSQYVIGGVDANGFMTCEWDASKTAAVVKALDVWWNGGNLQGIQVSYSNGIVSPLFGTARDQHKQLVLAPGERVTSLILWGNGVGTRTGRIRMTTNLQTLDVGKDTGNQSSYAMSIGSGILVGMDGSTGDDIHCLGAIFLNTDIRSILVKDIKFDQPLTGTQTGISKVNLSAVTYTGSKQAPNFNFTGSRSEANTTTYEQTSTTTFGLSATISVEASIFDIVKVSASSTWQWSESQTQSQSTSNTDDITLLWSLSGTLEPGEMVTCKAVCRTGHANVGYTSEVTVALADNSFIKYQERGVFKNVAWTEADAFSETLPSGTAPPLNEAIEVSGK